MIKQSDYPSFRLCVELTNLWLTNTSCRIHESEWVFQENDDDTPNPLYSCPTVMEMLNLMPWQILVEWSGYVLQINELWKGNWIVSYLFALNNVNNYYYKTEWTLPNALAEMAIHLIESNNVTIT